MEGDQDQADVEASWEVRQDEASGQIYYWNTITGETSWEPPPHLGAAEIVPPWTQAFDGSGRVYYLNTETMETRWTPPPTTDEHQEDAPITAGFDALSPTGGRGRRPSTAEQMTELNRLLSGDGEDGSDEESPEDEGDAAAHQETSEVPSILSIQPAPMIQDKTSTDAEACPWMVFVNDGDGVPYYYNQNTGECLWDPPEEFLHFHQKQQQQEPEGIDNSTVAGTTTEDTMLVRNVTAVRVQNGPAVSIRDNGVPDGAAMGVLITPEFEGKVRQAIATASSSPVGSSRLILVHTPTQQQLEPRMGLSVRDNISARSGLNSARPRSGSSRPSSGGAVNRPRTPSGGVPSSRRDSVLPAAETSCIAEDTLTSTTGIEPPEEVVPVDELPAPIEHGDEECNNESSGAEKNELVETTGNDDEKEKAGIEVAITSGAEAEAETVEGETDFLTAPDADIVANSHREEANDAGAPLQSLADTTDGVNPEVGITEVVTTEMADQFSDIASVQEIAALTLQCMIRCFIARQCVKHKLEERKKSSPPGADEIIVENDDGIAAAVTVAVVPEVENDGISGMPSLPAQEAQQEESFTFEEFVAPQSLAGNQQSNEDLSLAPPSNVDQQIPLKNARGDSDEAHGTVETLISASSTVPSVEVNRKESSSAKCLEQPPRHERVPISIRLPSVLDIKKYFPQRSSSSSRLAKTGSSINATESVAITRKKVDIESPLRNRRTSQQETERKRMEHVQLLETRRKEEERAQRAQVAEYQRIYADSRCIFQAEKQQLLADKIVRDNQRGQEAEVEKKTRIKAQRERDAARTRNKPAGDEANRLVWEYLKSQGRPTEQNVRNFRDALKQVLDPAQFPTKMCAERARELHERFKRLQRASWAVDSQLEAVELSLLSELHPLTDRQRPTQAKYAVKLRGRLEHMLDTVQAWQRALDELESGKENNAYWGAIQARYDPSTVTCTNDEFRRHYVLNEWRGAAGGDSLLHVAAWNGWEQHVRVLIDEGADVNLVDSSSSHSTPLHEACRAGHVSVVEQLLRSGARLDAVDIRGDSPLHVACRGGWTRIVRILLMAANGLGDEGNERNLLSLEGFFNLRNGKRRRAIEATTLPSLIEELENYDYQLNGTIQQGQHNNGIKQRQLKNER